MRLIVNGQQAFGKSTLEAILAKGEDEIVGVFCAPDKEGKAIDPLKAFAVEQNLPLFQPANYTDADVLEHMRSLQADLMLMAYMTIFVPEEAREIPTHGSICFHPSLLPKHRGPSSINWPIMLGSKQTGITVFWPDDGLDEGFILHQDKVDIGPDDTLGDIYFGKVFNRGVEMMLESVDMVRAGNAPKIPQDEDQATYESFCRKKDMQIDWSKPVAEVYNQIRGCNPQPGAWTTMAGEQLTILDSRKVETNHDAKAGEILSIEDDHFLVAAQGGAIKVMRVKPHDDGKLQATDFISKVSLQAGQVLGA